MRYSQLLTVTAFVVADTMCIIAAPALALFTGEYFSKALGLGLVMEAMITIFSIIVIYTNLLVILDFWYKTIANHGERLQVSIAKVLYIVNVLWFTMSVYYLFMLDIPTLTTVNTPFTFVLGSLLFLLLKKIGYYDYHN